MQSFEIRRFIKSDLPQVAYILSRQLTYAENKIHYPFLREDYYCLVAVSTQEYVSQTDLYMITKGQIVGFGSIFLLRKFFREQPVGLIEDIVTEEHAQGKGIGKAIVNALTDYAKISNAYKVLLNCNDDNIPFYEKCGFHYKCNTMRKDL